MATLLTLAPELIHRIADHMCTPDVRRLRLSCRQMADFLEYKLLHTIALALNQKHATQGIEMLDWLANSPEHGPVCRSARRLVIGSLCPIHESNFLGPFSEKLGNISEPAYIRDSRGELIGLSSCLSGALSSLKNVSHVIWRTEYEDTECSQNIVASALVSMPYLERLDVMLANSRIVLPLQEMKHLREVTISEGNTPSNSPLNTQTFANLADLISRAPPGQLTRIQAEHGYYDTVRTDPQPNLHQLLGSYPEDKPPLQLRHLGITNSFVRFDQRTLPHLRHLTSLDLSNIIQPREQMKIRRGRYQIQQPVDPSIYKSQRTFGATSDELWSQLCSLEIWLEHITLSDVAPAFLDYLSSYSGLKSLCLRVRGLSSEAESNSLARSFYEEVLPRHTHSLELLMVEAAYEGLWCFGDHSASVILACKRLRDLRMSLVTESITGPGARSIKNVETAIDTLISGTSLRMPDLADIRLYIANVETYRRSFCGTNTLQHYSWATKRITEHIYRYTVSAKTHPSIPTLHVGPRVFEPGRARPTAACSYGSTTAYQWRYRMVSAEPGFSTGMDIMSS